jgi:hypothetical protein
MKLENLRTLIRESISEYIKEIDEAAENAAMEARVRTCEEAIATREAKLNAIAESDHKDLMDEGKIKGLENEIKELKKAKAKFEKAAEKKAAKKAKKSAPKEEEEEVVTDAVTEEAPIDETDVMAEMDMEEASINESFLKMQKLAGVITEAQYNEKKRLIENKVTNNPVVQKLEKKAFDFINQPQVAALIKKEIDKLSPEKKAELAKTVMQEGDSNDFSSFKTTVNKVMNDVSLTEDMHDFLRQKVGGYKKGEGPNDLDKLVGKILKGIGVVNIMSMGFLPAVTGAALDYFGGTNILQTVGDAVGSGSVAAGLSVLAGLLGGAFVWKMGKIVSDERDDYITENQLNEDEVDLKLTELKNQKVADLKKEMEEKKLIVYYKLGGKEFKPEPKSTGSGWDAKTTNAVHNAYITWNGEPNGTILVGIGKDTNKAQEILPFVEKTFKEEYDIQKGGNANFWEINIVPKQK